LKFTTAVRKLVEIWTVFFRYASGETNRQTDTQTDTLIAILGTHTGSEVKVQISAKFSVSVTRGRGSVLL